MCSWQPQLLLLSDAKPPNPAVIRAAAAGGREEMSAVIREGRGQQQAKWSRGPFPSPPPSPPEVSGDLEDAWLTRGALPVDS